MIWLIWIISSSPVRASDLALNLKEAVEWALSGEGSSDVQMAQELIREVEARSGQSRAELLPHLEASIGQQEQTRNLEALGLRSSLNFRPPTLVGPFSTFDARARLTQSIFNLSSTRRFQASRSAVLVAKNEQENIQDQVASQVARSYLEALRNRARLDAARANLDLAAARAATEVARQEVRLQRAGHYPTLDFVASRDKVDASGGIAGSLPRRNCALSSAFR